MNDPLQKSGLECPNCGYNLTALTVNRCPECGQVFQITTQVTGPPSPNVVMLRRISTVFYIVGAAIVILDWIRPLGLSFDLGWIRPVPFAIAWGGFVLALVGIILSLIAQRLR